MSIINKASAIVESNGYPALIQRVPPFLYKKSIRLFVPQSGYYHKNNVRWKVKKLTDSLTHPDWSDDPDYEDALISAVREYTRSGDFVGVIGGGRGISAVAAAKKAGETGSVNVYEASSERIEWINRTVELNNVETTVRVEHALVGPDIQVYGEMGSVTKVSSSELPDFDLLEMDCEGSELDILNNLIQRPRVIILEVHPPEVSVKKVESTLDEYNYEIVDQGWENEDSDNPLPVITAKHCG